MHIQKNKIIAVGLILLGICFALFGFTEKTNEESKTTALTEDTYTTSLSDLKKTETLETKNPLPTMATSGKTVSNFVKNADWLYATVVIEGKSFDLPFLKGETILDAMTTVMNEDVFTFSGKDFSGIGFFIDSINGKKAEQGKSYILWINGKKAEVGVSGYQLVAGDVISWTYEDNY